VLCDTKCAACSMLSTNCSACANSYYLFASNFTCLSSCPAGYAADSTNHICVACSNSACLSCSATNTSYCYSCNSTTFWLAFDCLSTCPTSNYFPTSPNCTQCDPSCLICTGSPSPCTQCNTGYKLSGTVCSSSCLTQYGPTTNTSLCVLCDIKCTACNLVSTNCTACTTTAPN
jgi:hypothetical protein